jgi:hypothetical protein
MVSLFQLLASCYLLWHAKPYCGVQKPIETRLTFSAHLWKASSTVEFVTAWNEKQHYLIRDFEFKDLLETARSDDIDQFGRMILVSVLGKDDVEGWFHTRGGGF